MAAPIFLYDDSCPMCQGYTCLFSRLKWSDRRGFGTLGVGEWPALDRDRGRHEIPLLDPVTGEIRYGLDAMAAVLGRALPPLRPIVENRYVIAALGPLYRLITYNRRIIAGTRPPASGFDCAPDVHRGWRLIYLGLALAVVYYCGLPSLPLLIGFGLSLVAGLLLHADRLEFLGNFVTVMLGAALLLQLLPGWLGLGATYLFVCREGWRRLGP